MFIDEISLKEIKQTVLFYYFILLSSVLVITDLYFSEVIKYSLLPLSIFIVSISDILIVKKYLLIFLLLLVITPVFSSQYFFELVFILSGLSILSFNPLSIKKIDVIVLFTLFLFVLYNYRSINLSFTFDSFVKSETSATESNLISFISAFLVLFYWRLRKYVMFFISALLFVITFKRIVFIGLILAFLSLKLSQKSMKILVLCMFIVGVLFYPILSIPSVKEFLENISGLSIGHLLQGRFLFYEIGFSHIQQNWISIFIGNGQGSLVVLLSAKLGYFSLFHGDIFKWFFEHGVLGVIFVIYLLRGIEVSPYHLLFVNFMLTDNVLIYTPVIHWLWLVIEREKLHSS